MRCVALPPLIVVIIAVGFQVFDEASFATQNLTPCPSVIVVVGVTTELGSDVALRFFMLLLWNDLMELSRVESVLELG